MGEHILHCTYYTKYIFKYRVIGTIVVVINESDFFKLNSISQISQLNIKNNEKQINKCF